MLAILGYDFPSAGAQVSDRRAFVHQHFDPVGLLDDLHPRPAASCPHRAARRREAGT